MWSEERNTVNLFVLNYCICITDKTELNLFTY